MIAIVTRSPTLFERLRPSTRATLGAAAAFLWLDGCSLQSFDYMHRPATSLGGSSAARGAGGAGASGSGGAKGDAAGAGMGGGGYRDPYGSEAGDGNSMESGGAPALTSGGGGLTADATCLAYTGATGLLLKPPSTGFEEGIGWTTVSSHPTALTRVESVDDACEGSAYLTCDGTARTAGWDGPAVELLGYVTLGHKYAVSVVTRFTPASAPTVAKLMGLTISMSCSDPAVAPTFNRLLQKSAFTNWTRFSGQFEATLAGCADPSRIVAYVETDAIDMSYSIDVDDFLIYDITPQ